MPNAGPSSFQWDKLSPAEFQQLQELASYSTRKLQDVLNEFCEVKKQSPDGMERNQDGGKPNYKDGKRQFHNKSNDGRNKFNKNRDGQNDKRQQNKGHKFNKPKKVFGGKVNRSGNNKQGKGSKGKGKRK